MGEFFTKLFDTSDFPARWHCGNWSDFLGWLHILSDVAIWAAYFAIPLLLIHFARKRRDFPFTKLFWLFAAFILACGTVHLVEATIFWHPIHRVSGLVKFVTAVVSWATVIALIPIIPKAMHLPSLATVNTQLATINAQLASEIEERKRVEHELRTARDKLQQSERLALAANRSKSAFLANMSHEIRTPMSGILGYADVLLGHLKNRENRNCVIIMKRNGEHLLELINDILDLSQIEADKLRIDMEDCPISLLVGDVHSLMRVRAEEKKLRFVAEFEGEVPELLRTDPRRLRQVLINLIGNAIKFTDEGEVRLIVKLLVGAEPPVIEFAVRDTGIGMDEVQRNRLFQPFSQGDASVSRSYEGSGLGLAISKRLVQMLGGEVEVQSEPNRGSVFYVRLPVGSLEGRKLIRPGLFVRPVIKDEAESDDRQLACRVLVVDDRRDIRHISRHFLEKAGASVSTAEDGRKGIATAIHARDSGKPFDLIVMDMQMPEIDGLHATAELRSAGLETPIIALTADAMKGDRDRCLNGGCDDYLPKPVEHAQLVAMVAYYTQDVTIDELRTRRINRASTLRESLAGLQGG